MNELYSYRVYYYILNFIVREINSKNWRLILIEFLFDIFFSFFSPNEIMSCAQSSTRSCVGRRKALAQCHVSHKAGATEGA